MDRNLAEREAMNADGLFTEAAPLLLSVIYLGVLTALSFWAQRSPLAGRLTQHPLAFGLAMGVYATTWTFYGSVGFATRYGYGFAAVSLGVVLSCLAIPILWQPLSRIVRNHRLSSVADLLAYRYQSQTVGIVVTVFMLAGLLPYVSLQLRAIGDAAHALAGDNPFLGNGVSYTLLLMLFAAGVGAHFADPWRKQTGLVAVLAMETLFKMLALLVVGSYVLFNNFEGPSGLLNVLEQRPEILERLYEPVQGGSFPVLITCSFMAAFLLPRQFHVAFVLRPSPRALAHATWTLPLVLLLLNLPLPILLVAGELATEAGTPPDLYVLLAASSPLIRTISFLGGVSAASAMVLVSTIALSGMVVHHLWQPFMHGSEVVARTPHVRRMVVVLLILAAFFFHSFLPRRGSLVDLGLVSFTAVLQLIPGVVGTLFWSRASRTGFLWGLAAGIASWVASAWLPLVGLETPVERIARTVNLNSDMNNLSIWISFLANCTLFFIGSLWSPPGDEECAAAASCRPKPGAQLAVIPPDSVPALEQRLAAVLGTDAAKGAVDRARADLGLKRDERGVLALLKLLERTQRNLAEALGPLSARTLLSKSHAPDDQALLGAELLFLEQRLAGGKGDPMQHVYGFMLSALSDLPIGLCALDGTRRVAVWNQALSSISGLSRDEVLGVQLERLPSPWCVLLDEEAESKELSFEYQGSQRTLRLHHNQLPTGALVMIEDLTEEKALRDHLAHHARLVSVGQLAAGVAHEIGNPLAGLLMVARNLREDMEEPDAPERIDAIVREGKRIETIVHSLLTFCRRGGSNRELQQVSVADVVHEAMDLIAMGARGQSHPMQLDIQQDTTVLADRASLVQVVVNLVSNALDASPTGGMVRLRVQEDAHQAYIEVEDEGPGVDPQLEPMLFTPFVTSKEAGQGTGLGLAISLRIAQDHNGSIDYRRLPAGITCFRLSLPRFNALGAAS